MENRNQTTTMITTFYAVIMVGIMFLIVGIYSLNTPISLIGEGVIFSGILGLGYLEKKYMG
jgi:MFS superfamily sulfate permease-like transporter